jgi:N6-adenosine-specific RNA methylase IME4
VKYNIIYADPPWPYKVYSRDTGSGRSAESHYNTMSIEDIKSLPVGSIAADNAVLFLWVTNPTLEYAFEVIRAWGFTYKTVAFNWLKINKKADSWFWGMGFWSRANGEELWIALKENSPKPYICDVDMNALMPMNNDDDEVLTTQKLLIASKGHPKRLHAGIHQIVDSPVIIDRIGEHSAKPPIFRDLIIKLMGPLPRVELFAREKIDGWDRWGNEVESTPLEGFPPVPLYEEKIDGGSRNI